LESSPCFDGSFELALPGKVWAPLADKGQAVALEALDSTVRGEKDRLVLGSHFGVDQWSFALSGYMRSGAAMPSRFNPTAKT
jgi:hypothetical protein